MSQVPAVSAPGSERSTSSPASGRTPSSTSAAAPKLRSCVICRSRKVRCDKKSPCSNCRRANIACVFPSTDGPPRWARRLERLPNNATASNAPTPQHTDPSVGERLRHLENLVKELSGQLEQAHAAASLADGASFGVDTPASSTQYRDAEHQKNTSSATNSSSVQKEFGRLVLQNPGHSRYVSSGFWAWVNDEVRQPLVVMPSF